MPDKRKSTKKTSSEQSEAETDPTTDANELPESPEIGYITNEQLQQILKDNQKTTETCIKNAIKQELANMKVELVRLQSELETVSAIASNAQKLSEQLKKDCTLLKEENVNLKAKLQNVVIEQDKICEVIEDNKNRQLRKTLVFKGIPEAEYEGSTSPSGAPTKRSETWEDTATILATSMSEALNVDIEAARDMVERCHRAAPNPRYKGSAPRPIFAAFVNWRDSERTKEAFRKNNLSSVATSTDSSTYVFVENKFGPRTTQRRNLALKERKRLIETGQIYNGYVSHPAKLMVKDSRVHGAKYKMWKDYSKEAVKTDR